MGHDLAPPSDGQSNSDWSYVETNLANINQL